MDYPSDQPEGPDSESGIPYPSVGEFLNPFIFVGFLRAFVGGWFLSRNYRILLLAVPTLIFGFFGAYVTWRMSQPPSDDLAIAYHDAAISASRVGSDAGSEIMWERLMQLRPDEQSYQFILATSLADRDQFAEAGRHLEALTGEHGYAPARLWIVQQSREDGSVFSLTREQQITQLQMVLDEESYNVEAHRLLAQIHVERGDYRVAEQHLLRAAERHPTLGLLLYELQVHLKRENKADGLRLLRRAAAGFEEKVIQSPGDVQSRIFWSQALDHLGETVEAEAILTEALKSYDTPKLRAVTARFMIRKAQLLLEKSPLNSPAAAKFLVKAAQLQPDHQELPLLCLTMAETGARFSESSLAPMVVHLRKNVQSEPSDLGIRVTLAKILTMLGQHTAAAELLEEHQNQNTRVRALLAQIYRELGRTDEARTLTDSVLLVLQKTVDGQPDQARPITELVHGLMIAGRLPEAISIVDDFAERTNQDLHELPSDLRRLYVAASVAQFQVMAEDAVDENAYSLIKKAAKAGYVSGALIQLLSNLAYSQGLFAKPSNDMLTGLLAEGQINSQVYSSLGNQALLAGYVDAAVQHLQLALAQAPRDPGLQNNLALALIRQSADNAGTAYKLCSQALETVPGHPDALSTRAEIQMARNRWAEARIDLETALPSRPHCETVRGLLIRLYTELNETGLADEHRRVLEAIRKSQTQGPKLAPARKTDRP